MLNLREIKHKIKSFRIKNGLIRSFFSEFLGTFVFITFGLAASANYILGRGFQFGDYLALNLSWGMGAGMGIYISLGATGGHVNPAVSFTMMCLGRLTPLRFVVYIAAQFTGAFVAAASVFGIYLEAINNFDGGVRTLIGVNQTMSIFVTSPQPFVSVPSIVADSIFGTMLLLLVIMGATDMKNVKLDSGLLPISLFVLISLEGLTFGLNSGNTINPARDLGPRMFCALVGYGVDIFQYCDYYFWIPLVAPFIGGLCGGLIYLVLIERHLPDLRKHIDPLEKYKDLEIVYVDAIDQKQKDLETISESINPS